MKHAPRPRSLFFRKFLLLSCALAGGMIVMGGLTGCASTSSAGSPSTASSSGKKVKKVDFLFVQSATGISVSKDRIVLHGVNPLTIAFSDRPDRIAAHMTTKKFIPMWSHGTDSFLSNPPNATLSVFRGDEVSSTVIVLRNPRLAGNDLSYEVRVLEGKLPTESGPCSLFIDIIGMPMTPFSYAGASRRAWRHGYAPAAYYPPAYYAPPVAYYPPPPVAYYPAPTVVQYGYPVVRPAVVW